MNRESAQWDSALDAGVTQAIRRLCAEAEAADGLAPLSGHLLEALGADEYALVRVGADVVGVGVAHHDDPAEVFVAPAHRRRGLGGRLVDAALDRTGAVWAHGDLPPARNLAATRGLIRTRELLQMRRPLSPEWAHQQVMAAQLPPGVRLRTFVPGRDEEQFLGVNARAFAWHPEQGRLDLAGLQAEMSQSWFDPDGFFLAVDEDDTVLGFHWTKVHTAKVGTEKADTEKPDTGNPVSLGEVYVLGVDPCATLGGGPVRGLGGPLTAAGLAYLAARGLRTVLLYVEGDNVKALNLYRRIGFETFSKDVVYRRIG